jgi:hypothetical protein
MRQGKGSLDRSALEGWEASASLYSDLIYVLEGRVWRDHRKAGKLCSICAVRWPCLAIQLAVLKLRLVIVQINRDEEKPF